MLILVEKREGERGKVWHQGGGCGLPETGEEQCRPLPPQAQLDVPSCLPQIPKAEKGEAESKKWRVRELLRGLEDTNKQRKSRVEKPTSKKKEQTMDQWQTEENSPNDLTSKKRQTQPDIKEKIWTKG